ncbi:response regulator transcription factor [Frankia sp. AgB32]|uniref:response regulator n=1 Tax=Frankia sp. AgB32 TaxID=631119 RepID=UPI0020103FB3|nr:response regulator transcription factor [Frankia sp. AgB32]MCK9893413.1 response regulator transcription factor [Frankia sp. AgB32]
MRVVIGEDGELLLDTLTCALEQRGVDVVGQARSLPEVLAMVEQASPEVVILDIRMPPTHRDEGILAAERIRLRRPEIGLLVLSDHAETAYAERLLNMQEDTRAVGYVTKARVGNVDSLLEALRRVRAGEIVIDPGIIDRLMSRRRRRNPLDRLTAQERRVLALVAEGRTNRGVADELGCTAGTVEKHLTSINDKLGLRQVDTVTVNIRVLAVLTYLRHEDAG